MRKNISEQVGISDCVEILSKEMGLKLEAPNIDTGEAISSADVLHRGKLYGRMLLEAHEGELSFCAYGGQHPRLTSPEREEVLLVAYRLDTGEGAKAFRLDLNATEFLGLDPITRADKLEMRNKDPRIVAKEEEVKQLCKSYFGKE